ncbi:MAG TPA: hypothetical protein EYG67_04885 [Campylobacterales bacterium]|nr:hypothetical protein [Campylobacterales bacterium]HIP42254.1 hypothetical protein [Campylobacterales bacterium]
MKLIYGLIIALVFIATAYFTLADDLTGHLLGAFGILFGAFIYYSSATTTASEAIEYTDPHAGGDDIVFDTIRTFLLVFISGFIASEIINIALEGIFNIYMVEILVLFLLFSYISFWELKHTIHHTLKAMFMLDAPKKFV